MYFQNGEEWAMGNSVLANDTHDRIKQIKMEMASVDMALRYESALHYISTITA